MKEETGESEEEGGSGREGEGLDFLLKMFPI